LLAASFEWIATWPFRRQVGPGKFARMADLEGEYPWDVEANDTIFQLHIDRKYRRLLSVLALIVRDVVIEDFTNFIVDQQSTN